MSDSIKDKQALSEKRRALAEKLLRQEGLAAPTRIPPRKRGNPAPASFAQQRLWFMDQLLGGTPVYNYPKAVRLCGPLNLVALKQILSEIVRRHEALRTSFVNDRGQPLQIISSSHDIALVHTDLAGLREQEREAEA
ncbi:MAG: condensation domain-containing protein, partial [Blastocatellia bacterium]